MKNFWHKIKAEKGTTPIMVLAPMADVTDVSFRRVIAQCGKPDVMWTEFVSADGLIKAPNDNPNEQGITSQDKLRADLKYAEIERPIVAQLFGSRVENMEKAAALCAELGFDGIDLNMGCPDKSIEKQGCGSAMIKNPESAVAIIRAVKRGAPNLPVSVKTRLGYNKDQLEEWLPILLAERPAVVTIHARTRKEMSKVPARWERVARAVEIRDEVQADLPADERTLIFGNGDVDSLEKARDLTEQTKCDGVMVGRGIFGNPWFFGGRVPGVEERLNVLVEHTKLFAELLPHKNFALMKKHYKSYTSCLPGAHDLKLKLMECNTPAEVEAVVEGYLTKCRVEEYISK
jgi:tRNA-dihydrouridine synthase B